MSTELQEPTIRDNGKEKKKGKKKLLLLLLLLLLLVSIAATLFLHQQGYFLWPWETATQMVSGNLTKGELGIGGDPVDFQKAADEGNVTMQLNTEPHFKDGKGDLLIQNVEANKYDMKVLIYLGDDDTGEMVYDSGRIPPGNYIGYDELNTTLSVGEHKAIAYVSFWDGNNHMTTASASMTLVIES